LVVSALLAGIFDDPSNPPFSIDRIRDSLAQTPPEPALLPAAQPQFRVNIVERQRFGDRVLPDFRGGTVPPGGLYAYEQRQRIGPPMAQALVVRDITQIASAVVGAIREAIRSGRVSKLGGLLVRPKLTPLRESFSQESVGGAYLLGLRGLVVVCHGNSSRRAIANAIALAERGVDDGLVKKTTDSLAAAGVLRAPGDASSVVADSVTMH